MKIGILITARLKSSRLERKILLPLNGKSIIDWIIGRAKNICGSEGVVLCTSTNVQDSVLYKNALKNGIEFYPGSEVDVLDRLYNAATYFGYDAFINVTADNPLFSMYCAEIMIDWFKKENFDFGFVDGLPIGMDSHFVKVDALKIANFIRKESDTEIWGPFVNQPDFFRIANLTVQTKNDFSKKRLTCDYSEDYKLLEVIYNMYPLSINPPTHSVINKLIDNESLWTINEVHKQIRLPKEKLEEISKAFSENIEKGKKFAVNNNFHTIPGTIEKTIHI